MPLSRHANMPSEPLQPVCLCATNITKTAHLWTILILRDIDSLTPVVRPCQRSTLINKGQVNGFVYRGGIQTEAIVLAP